jgi:hypothetical protein
MGCKQKKSKGPLCVCADRSAKGRKGLWKYIHSHFQLFSVGSRARIRLQGGGPTFFLQRVVRRASLEEFHATIGAQSPESFLSVCLASSQFDHKSLSGDNPQQPLTKTVFSSFCFFGEWGQLIWKAMAGCLRRRLNS